MGKFPAQEDFGRDDGSECLLKWRGRVTPMLLPMMLITRSVRIILPVSSAWPYKNSGKTL